MVAASAAPPPAPAAAAGRVGALWVVACGRGQIPAPDAWSQDPLGLEPAAAARRVAAAGVGARALVDGGVGLARGGGGGQVARGRRALEGHYVVAARGRGAGARGGARGGGARGPGGRRKLLVVQQQKTRVAGDGVAESVLEEDRPLGLDQPILHRQLQLQLLDRQVLALHQRLVHKGVLLQLQLVQLELADPELQLEQLLALRPRRRGHGLGLELLALPLVLPQPLQNAPLHARVLVDGAPQLLALGPRRPHPVGRRPQQVLRRATVAPPAARSAAARSATARAATLLVVQEQPVSGLVVRVVLALGRPPPRVVPLDDDHLPLPDLHRVLHVLVLELDERPPQLHPLPKVVLNPSLHARQLLLVDTSRGGTHE
mmetsp:Transcript_3153/g.7300  ORF Transcript_3153/g.7300 Transcript_3153/m.7300 type:complete len:374 (+) Transcript_3153:439-1560(+)